MIRTIALLLIAGLSLTACKSKKETTTTTNNTTSKQIQDNKMRLVVSFISFGAGIDHETFEKFEAFINSQTKKVEFKKANWGREGEVDFCFSLKELSTKEQDEFVKKAKEILSGKELIKVEENVPCPR